MEILFWWFLIGLHLPSILPAENCSKSNDVYAVVGEELTLPASVVETRRIKKIAWVNSRAVKFATSYPNGSIEILVSSYDKRLTSINGSLMIKDLKKEDASTITATIYLSDGDDCFQTYRLNVTDKCGATKKVSAQAGGFVTLQVNEITIKNVSWERPVGVHFATTKPGGYLNGQVHQYNGKLLRSDDKGSLIIPHLSPQDEGDYRAIMFQPDGERCAQTYNVYISDTAENLKAGVGVHAIPGVVLAIATLQHFYV